MINDELIRKILSCQAGSVVAPAGCGKTECITDVVRAASGRYLILTHTLAGVDALRDRLQDKGISPRQFNLETIAGWSLRFAGAFPLRSGLTTREPKGDDWAGVYKAAEQLVAGGFIARVLKASYCGVLVDEYQDCTLAQHHLTVALSKHLGVCVFGDYLQAIFGFRGDKTVDWKTEVLPAFPLIDALHTPWRWKRVGNVKFGKWLIAAREQLDERGEVDLSRAPSCVTRIAPVSLKKNDVSKANNKACGTPTLRGEENLIIIGDKASEKIRAKLASRVRCTSIEPIACKRLAEFISQLKNLSGKPRLQSVLKFAADIMAGTEKALFERRVEKLSTGWRGTKSVSEAELAALDILTSNDFNCVLGLLEALRKKPRVVAYRRELLFATENALRLVISGEQPDMESATWYVQNKMRHAGRRLPKRSVGSTLLVKGLQFDHAVIIAPGNLAKNDLYVALTRASKTLTIVSAEAVLRAKGGR